MKNRSIRESLAIVSALGGFLLALGGCGGGTLESGTQMNFTATPTTAQIGQEITFTVTGTNSARGLTSASIDYENDGVWDDTRSHHDSSVTETFQHGYGQSGNYTAVARIVDEYETTTKKSIQITVTEPPKWRLAFEVYASSDVASGGHGTCYACGPPATSGGTCAVLFTTDIDRRMLGWYAHGATASISQQFKQDQGVGGGVGVVPYSCDYTLAVFVGNNPGSETLLATGRCSTSSYEPYDPAHLTCTATLDVTVP